MENIGIKWIQPSTVLEHSLSMHMVALYLIEYSCVWVFKKVSNNENELLITTT
jgi:hypothetical protein